MPRLNSVGVPAFGQEWLNDFTRVYQVCTTHCWIETNRNGVTNVVAAKGANVVQAGGDVWAAFLADGHTGLYTSQGWSFPQSGIGPVGPDGAMAIKTLYNSFGPWDVLEKNGVRWQLTPNDASGILMLGGGKALWFEGGQPRVRGIPMPLLSTNIVYNMKALFVNGEWWALYQQDFGPLVLHPFDSYLGYILTPAIGDKFWTAIAKLPSGLIRCAWATGEADLASQYRNVDQDLSLPRTNVRNSPPIVVPITRQLYVGCYAGTPTSGGGWTTLTPPESLPGNSYLLIYDNVLFTREHKPVMRYVEGRPSDGNIDDIERAIAKLPKDLPILAYWPEGARSRIPAGAAFVGIDAYRGKDEALDTFEHRVANGISKASRVILIPQCFTSNETFTTDLASIVPVTSNLVRDFGQVEGVMVFNGSGRATGMQDHPDVRPLWQSYFNGVIHPPIEEYMVVPKITVKNYGKTIEKGKQWQVSADIGDTSVVVNLDSTGNLTLQSSNSAGSDSTGAPRHVDIVCPNPTPIPPDPGPTPEPEPSSFPIETWRDTFFALRLDNIITQQKIVSPSTFEFVSVSNGVIALKGSNGKFCAVEGTVINCNRDSIGEWEQLKIAQRGDGFTLQAYTNKFVSARDNGEITVTADVADEWETFYSQGAVFNKLSPLATDRQSFTQEGKPWRYKGVTAFKLLDRFKNGENIDPFLDAYKGFNVLRIFAYTPVADWGASAWGWPNAMDLKLFVDYVATRGFFTEFVLLTDDNPNNVSIAQSFVPQLTNLKTLLLEIGNEPDTHKDIDTKALRRICEDSGYLFSSGNYEDSNKFFGTYLTAHTGRDNEWPRRAHDLMEYYNGGGPNRPSDPSHKVPCIGDEPIRPDQAAYNVQDFIAYYGACSILGGGATIHTETGKLSTPPTANEQTCINAALLGLDAFDPGAPYGPYSRPVEDSLRTYVVGNCMVRIRPTALSNNVTAGWQGLDPWGILWKR